MALVLSSAFASAIDFDFSSPERVQKDVAFEVEISASSAGSESYDVKIFVGQANKQFSEIEDNGQWRSPYRYLAGAFPQTRVFRVIAHFTGESEICVRLRKSSTTMFDERCKPIEIISNNEGNGEQNAGQSAEQQEGSETAQDGEREGRENSTANNPSESFGMDAQESRDSQTEQKLGYGSNEEPIELNPLPRTQLNEQKLQTYEKQTHKIAGEEQQTIVGIEGKKEKWVLYGFLMFCILLIVLLAMNKLN